MAFVDFTFNAKRVRGGACRLPERDEEVEAKAETEARETFKITSKIGISPSF